MPEPDKKPDDEERFNETLKRMLKTPPKPHDKAAKPDSKSKRPKQHESDRKSQR